MSYKIKDPKSLIQGIFVTLVTEAGPEIISNVSTLSEDLAFITAAHLLSLAGLMEGREKEQSEIIGPVPVKGRKDVQALFFLTLVDYNSSSDSRLVDHGTHLGVVLIFPKERISDVRRATGLIEPYLQMFFSKNSQKVRKESIDENFGKELLNHIIELVTSPQTRAFWFDENSEKMIEYRDNNFVKKEHDVVLIDEGKKTIYLFAKHTSSPFKVRRVNNAVNNLNLEFYKNSMKIVKLDNYDEAEPLLIKYGITMV